MTLERRKLSATTLACAAALAGFDADAQPARAAPDCGGDGATMGEVVRVIDGKSFLLADGRVITADEAYIRESILHPSARITAGYQPIMPTFQGLVSEEQLLQLVEYVKSLKAQPEVPTARPTAAGPAPGEATAVKK